VYFCAFGKLLKSLDFIEKKLQFVSISYKLRDKIPLSGERMRKPTNKSDPTPIIQQQVICVLRKGYL
jgi:hypothetical protein